MATYYWRLMNKRYAQQPLSEGARRVGGHWNRVGTDVIYASQSKSAAVLRTLAHLSWRDSNLASGTRGEVGRHLLSEYCAIPIAILGSIKHERIELGELPDAWQEPWCEETKEVGERFVRERKAALLLAPGPVYGEYDVVINPAHPDFVKIVPGPMESIFSSERPLMESRIVSNLKTHREVFLCHSSKDKDAIVAPLYKALFKAGISAWYDNAEINWGDHITAKINEGLAKSDFVIAILTDNFLSAAFAKGEFGAVLNRDLSYGESRLLPLLAGTKDFRERVLKEFPLVRDRLYQLWSDNPDEIAATLHAKLRGQNGI